MKHQALFVRKRSKNCLSLLLSLLLFFSFSAPASAAEKNADPLSPALFVLAEKSPMAMAGLAGGSISFEKNDFARALNLSTVRSVTVTEIPPVTDGELRLGNVVLNGEQTLSASSLSMLTYVPAKEGISASSFRFTVNSSPVEMTCRLYMIDKVNHAPTLESVPKTALSVSTHQNITLWGELPSYDPDGDPTEVEIVSYPEDGILRLTDPRTGTYTYTPTTGRTGKDSFTYVVRDLYGNYSASATVSLRIVKPSTSVVFRDMTDDPGYNAALSATEAGLMSGFETASGTEFRPELTVSRGEFLVMAMKAVGIEDPGKADTTVFADDRELTAEERNYVSAAYRLGHVKGEERDGALCFLPDRPITRAEAAVILGRMLNATAPTLSPVFTDSEDIPTFARSSIEAMTHLGILRPEDGKALPREVMTRMDTAKMLTALMSHREG